MAEYHPRVRRCPHHERPIDIYREANPIFYSHLRAQLPFGLTPD